MRSVGYLALSTMISCARIVISTPRLNDSTSSEPSSFWNLRRLSDARLHAESSRYMYSEHGFEALIRPDAFDVCHSLTVVSNCKPGSPHCHAASATCRHKSRARTVSTMAPVVTLLVCHTRSRTTASMNSSVTRTELFEFWKNTDP